MGRAKKDELLSKRQQTETGFKEDEYEVPGYGTVRYRSLSRFEVLHLEKIKGALAFEQFALSAALIDPTFTEAEVKQWQKVSDPGELDALVKRITELSGMGKTAAKEAYKAFEADPGSEFRDVPGGETDDDRQPASLGDV